MYIRKAQLNNFGKFHDKTVYFTPGLNVVYGENESGKSTLQSFLTGMMFGLEKPRGKAVAGGQRRRISSAGDYQRYEPWNTASYYAGSMEFTVAGREFTLERNFYYKEKTAFLYNPKDGEELSVEHGDLNMLLGGISRNFYENTCCIAQAAVVTETDFAGRLQQELANRVHGGETGIDIGQAMKLLEQKRHQEEQKLKSILLQKEERKNRLEWEQELLTEDIRRLEQKLAVESDRLKQEQRADSDRAEQKQAKDSGKPEGILFRIPVIGWLLRLFRWIFRHFFVEKVTEDEKMSESAAEDNLAQMPKPDFGDILLEQLEEKRTRFGNVYEELEEARMSSKEERELRGMQKSIALAKETLDKVAKESYRDGRADIEAEISGIFAEITGGKYDRIEVTDEGQVLLYGENELLSPGQLSRGAMEQLYFALRLGVSRIMLEEEPLPILLDETFCAYDEVRLRRTLRWLAGQKEQMILFTCQRRELLLLEELGIPHHRILL